MRTVEEILESKIKPRYKPDGFGGFKELIIEAMREYAREALEQPCDFCVNVDCSRWDEPCRSCAMVNDGSYNYNFELP